MQAPLSLPLQLSPALRAVLVILHLLPVFAVWRSMLPLWGCVAVSALVAVSAIYHGRLAWRTRAWRIVLHASGEALWYTPERPAGDAVRILPESVDLGWLVVLAWQLETGGKVYRHACGRDALPPEAWRDLRRWLRWQVVREHSQEN